MSLTAVRMLPDAIAMLGTGARRPPVGFLGWFWPRGLASIVFAIILLEEGSLRHDNVILVIVAITIGLSVLVHGLSAAPLADRYARCTSTQESTAHRRAQSDPRDPRARPVRA